MNPSDFRKARKQLGFTRPQMAKALGVRCAQVERIEASRRRAHIHPLIARLTEAMVTTGYRPPYMRGAPE